MDFLLFVILGTILMIGAAQVASRVPRTIIPLAAAEAIITSIGGYLSFLLIGTPLSNAQGTVIRSTVTSGYYSFIFVYGFATLVLSLCSYSYSHRKELLKRIAVIGLIIGFVSAPALIYYNFYVSYTRLISGVSYTIYPYAVQSAIPFAMGLLAALVASLFMLPSLFVRRKSVSIIIHSQGSSSTLDEKMK